MGYEKFRRNIEILKNSYIRAWNARKQELNIDCIISVFRFVDAFLLKIVDDRIKMGKKIDNQILSVTPKFV